MSLTRIGRPFLDRGADDALAHAAGAVSARVLGIADRVGDAQLLPLLVEQVDRKRAEARQPRDELRNLGQQLLEVEHRRHLAPELEQGRQQLGVGGRARTSCARRAWASAVCSSGSSCELYWTVPWTSLTLPLDYSAIERILPHRYPFLLVDRITELEPDKRIVGIKNVSLNERYLSHQPGELAGAAADDPHRVRRSGRRDPDPVEAGEPRTS